MIAGVFDALLARCSSLAVGSPPLPIAYPEVSFTPPASGRYLEVRVFANRNAWQSIAGGGMGQGLLQITAVWPKGQGVVAPGQIADAVAGHFPNGQAMFSGGYAVKVIGKPTAMSPNSDGPSLRIPVTVSWSASAA